MAGGDDSLAYPVIPGERADDLQGMEDADRAGLILFMAGNQFMAVPELVQAFIKDCPEAAPVAYETLPPGLELKQILAGGAYFRGKVLPGLPDVYTSVSREAMDTLARQGIVGEEDPFLYLRNRLSLMVAEGNPQGIREVKDLGREGVRVSQPDPEQEHIALYIREMYRRAGGEELVSAVMQQKEKNGETVFTSVHHRQTPQRILEGEADVGPVWWTEIQRARAKGLPLEGVSVGGDLDLREKIAYYAAGLHGCPNPENSRRFLSFLRSSRAQEIFRLHGFLPAA